MKKIIITCVFALLVCLATGQTTIPQGFGQTLIGTFPSEWKQHDTLIVPLGKYNYIKIGDKVYKVITTLEPATNEPFLPRTGILEWPGNLRPATDGLRLLPYHPDGHDIDPGFNQGDHIILLDSEPFPWDRDPNLLTKPISTIRIHSQN